MRIRSILVSGLLLTIGASSRDQQSGSPGQPATIRVEVNLVQLHVRVTDGSGRTVSGLGRDAFQLRVDGKPQPITQFQGEDAPVTAGIVIDNSASMAPKRSEVIASALAFARASNQQDQMFVVHFSDTARLGLPAGKPFTGDISELETAISRFEIQGATAIYDALSLAETQFNNLSFSRKDLLLITDGGDNASRQATLKDVLDGALKTGISIFPVGIFDETDRYRNPEVLKQLARVTGGAAFFPPTLGDTTAVCREIAHEIRSQYTIGFEGAEDGKFHPVTITANDPIRGKLTVHAREGYFAVKPPSNP
jgi:Ca-activated chloride channel family protein